MKSYPVFQCLEDFPDGQTQDIRLRHAQKYVRTSVSPDGAWWFVFPVCLNAHAGGWAPCELFREGCETHVLYQVSSPPDKSNGVLVSLLPLTMPAIRGSGRCLVYHDGFVAGDGHSGQGIAAGWVFSGCFLSGSVSSACICTEAAAGELLVIGRTEMYTVCVQLCDLDVCFSSCL